MPAEPPVDIPVSVGCGGPDWLATEVSDGSGTAVVVAVAVSGTAVSGADCADDVARGSAADKEEVDDVATASNVSELVEVGSIEGEGVGVVGAAAAATGSEAWLGSGAALDSRGSLADSTNTLGSGAAVDSGTTVGSAAAETSVAATDEGGAFSGTAALCAVDDEEIALFVPEVEEAAGGSAACCAGSIDVAGVEEAGGGAAAAGGASEELGCTCWAGCEVVDVVEVVS